MSREVFFLAILSLFAFQFSFSQQAYFQQEVAYEIDVSLDDSTHFLRGFETIEYTNNSPDELNTFYLHLWPNAYSSKNTAFAKQRLENGSTWFDNARPEEMGFIDSLDIRVNRKKVAWKEWENNPDVVQLWLNETIKPGQTISISTPFRIKIPKSFSRFGHVGQQYQVTQWYPKPAVYDHKGWHPMPYLDMGEFYSEFGSFRVNIDVPANYVVGATGDLRKGEKEKAWLSKREQLSRYLLDKKKLGKDFKFEREYKNGERKILQFYQEKVHDFAWFCDQDYFVLSDSVQLPNSERLVKVVAMFNAENRKIWRNSTTFLKKSVYNYSLWVGNYPYNHATAVDGALSAGAGMEYPNITVVGASDEAFLENVIMHEVGHNWFYGILGTNERIHPWMDEGMNSYIENRYMVKEHNDKEELMPAPMAKLIGIDQTHSNLQKIGYLYSAMLGLDQPLTERSENFTETNYGTMVYMKTARCFRFLEDYLGREVSDKCLQAYYDKWKFKHPYPEDMQAVYEEVSGQDLDWFFDDFLTSTEKMDMKLKVRSDRIILKNKSDLKLPAKVTFHNEEGKQIGEIWAPPFEKKTSLPLKVNSKFVRVSNDDQFPEIVTNNNLSKTKGLFKDCFFPRFAIGYKYPHPDKTTINIMPSIGYNTTDGFMAGMLFYHNFLPKKRFEFHFMPMYGLKSKTLTGSSGLTYRWLPDKLFSRIELKSRTSRFSDLLSSRNYLDFYIRNRSARSPYEQRLRLATYHIGFEWAEKGILDDYYQPVFGEATYQIDKEHPSYKWGMEFSAGGNIAEKAGRGSIKFNYGRLFMKRYSIKFRGFAGGFLADGPVPYLIQYRMSGSGDPFGQHVLLDRNINTGWLSQQVVDDHGSFRSITGPNASFDRWIWSTGTDVQIPLKPLRMLTVFGDIGMGKSFFDASGNFYYDAGLSITLPGDLLRFNFPIAGTVYSDNIPSSWSQFSRQINFTLRLDRINDLLPF